MSSEPQTLSDFITGMNGISTTQGWDVVCSYSVTALNSFLAASYNQNQLATSVSVTTQQTDPLFKISYDATYDLTFGTPLLSFSTQRNTVALTIPILSGTVVTSIPNSPYPPSTTAFPAGYSVVATVPLAAVDATTGAPPESGPGVLVFSDGDINQYSIILQFTNSDSTFVMEPTPPSEYATLVLAIANYFQSSVNEIDYAIAAVNNQPAPDSGIVFTPASFVFSSYPGGTDGDEGSLSLWIQTVQSGNPAGSASPAFQLAGETASPVPPGYSASLILANALVLNTCLLPQLKTSGFVPTVETPSSGIAMSLAGTISVTGDGASGTFGEYDYSDTSVTLNDFPMKFTIANGVMQCTWSATAESSWSTNTVGQPYPLWGSVDINFAANLGPSALTADNNEINFPAFSFNSSTVTATPSVVKCRTVTLLIGCENTLPSFYKNQVQYTIPSITISFPDLNYFIETNLLAPGSQMISIDSSAGVGTPCDFLVVGTTTAAPSTSS